MEERVYRRCNLALGADVCIVLRVCESDYYISCICFLFSAVFLAFMVMVIRDRKTTNMCASLSILT